MKISFVKDENNLQLKKMFENNVNLKELHVDVYPDNPLSPSTAFMLLFRTSEKNATVSIENDRIVFMRNDKYKSYFMNLLFSEISECYYKNLESCFEFVLNIRNIYYRITIFN